MAVIGSDKITPKLLIEIKETNETKSEKRPKAVMKIISKDIEKLKEVAKLYPEKPQTVICFFYRSRKNGIPLQFKTDLEKEAKRIEKENILFLFGPKKKIT